MRIRRIRYETSGRNHITTAALAAHQGAACYTLAQATADPDYAAHAVPALQQAVDGFGPAYAVSRAVSLTRLAGAHALTADLDSAARTAHQAVAEITALALPRAYDLLRTLSTVLATHHNNPAIAEVREQIQTALIAA